MLKSNDTNISKRDYIVCPDCGYKLFKLGDGSNVEIYCPKCKAKLIIEIKTVK